MLTITHTHEAGTLIEGTAKGDGTADVLKSCGWRWGRSIAAWFIPSSRDRLPNSWKIRRTVEALQAAGFEVTTNVDTTTRSMAEVEADKIARQADRVDALDAKADRHAAAADEAWARHERDVARLPEGGEPIKVGHHSEGRHRGAIARADRSMRASITAADQAEETARRANAAAITTDARYAPATVANRIKTLGAELRRYERRLTEPHYDDTRGYVPATEAQQEARARRLGPRIEELRDQIAYWEQVRADQVAAGTATNYSRETIAKGDGVKYRGSWYRVVRVNPKSVSVQTPYSWTDTIEYAHIQDHKTAAGVAALEAKATA